jgi:hypothetical protein
MKMIEKMAQAINQARLDARDPFFHIDPEHCDYSKHLAKAALTTLLEPDEGMVEAGEKAADDGVAGVTSWEAGRCITAAIQHALAEGE